jgi:hypothetical protein
MANDKKFIVKNGLHTQNVDFVSPDTTEELVMEMNDDGSFTISGNSTIITVNEFVSNKLQVAGNITASDPTTSTQVTTKNYVDTADSGKVDKTTTVSAGSGLTGGGALSGNITISHADTSSQASANNSGLDFIQDITLDEYGHITGLTTVSAIDSSKADKTTTITASGGLIGGGDLSSNITISHADTSSQASVDNSGNTFIQDITLDEYGHITSITSAAASLSGLDATTLNGLSGSYYLDYDNFTNTPYNFGVVVVSGQSNVVADEVTDTLTLVAGTNITITTDDATDSVTFSSINTTYTAGNGIDLTGTTFTVGAGDGLSQSSTGLLVNSTVVRTTGDQSITGTKTFTDAALGTFVGALSGTFVGNGTGISNVDANLLDGQDGSYYLDYTNFSNVPIVVEKTSSTGSAKLPVGTEAQRDGTPEAGYLRYNTTAESFEGYDGIEWGPIGGGGGLEWSIISTNTTAEAGMGYFVDTSGGGIVVTLPSTAELGDQVGIVDYSGSFTTNICTVARNGHNIMGLTEDFECDIENLGILFVYADVTQGWKIVYTADGAGGGGGGGSSNSIFGSDNFTGDGGETTIAHELGGEVIFNVIVTPTTNPGGYLGEVWVRKDATNIYVGNSGSHTGAFDYTIVY